MIEDFCWLEEEGYDDGDGRCFADGCPIHGHQEDCDKMCGALKKPVTLEDYKLALVHWIEHNMHYGCSHGC